MKPCFPFALLSLLGLALAVPGRSFADDSKAVPATFTNPIGVGQDPCVVRDGDRYLWSQSDNQSISIYVSRSITKLGEQHLIWKPPTGTMYTNEVWAPELIKIRGRWYIYFAASDGQNINHRTYVLAAKTDDPLGEYEFHGPLYTGDEFETQTNNLWAIDMTVLEHGGELYALFSGWTTIDSDVQNLYVAPMKSPTEIAGHRVLFSKSDDYLWERVEENVETRGLNEGPQVLKNAGRTFVVYSCAASWLPTYKLGLLELVGDDPLDPAAWKKFSKPIFKSTDSTFGVGHGSFTESLSGSHWWHVYHAKDSRQPGWARSLFVQPMTWNQDGTPNLGQPVQRGEKVERPSLR